jgi:2-polyprenyl-6-methoxyphenol hydroxylase-like FAD-dependent oxidoreductase
VTRFDAIIIGAGPAGSTAAILLSQAGWSVALVEKQAFPRRKVCGECIAASNLPLLDALGIGAEFAAAAGPELRHVEFMHRNTCVRAELPPASDAKHRWGRALGRETLDTLLLDRARKSGAHILQPCRVHAIDGGVGDWNCHVHGRNNSRPRTLSAPLVIDAHGSWEALHVDHGQVELGQIDQEHEKTPRSRASLFAFKANFRGGTLAPGVLPILALNGGYGGIVVADGGITTLACCVRRDRLDALRLAAPGQSAGAVVEAWLKQQCAGVEAALAGATRDGSWLSSGPLKPGIRLQASDRIPRIGNAAGEAHPIIGEGMSMALQSAWMLCALLLAADRHADDWQSGVARNYAGQWRRQFAPRMRLAATFAHLAMRPLTALAVLALARAWPGLLTQGARRSGKLTSAARFDSLPLTTGASP